MRKRKQQSFAIVSALFILVILGLLSGFIVAIAALTRETTIITIKRNQAIMAAKSGLEWGKFRVINDANCPGTTNLNLTQAGAKGFTVTVTCSQITYEEEEDFVTIYSLTSTAAQGTFGSNDYISKQLTEFVGIATPS